MLPSELRVKLEVKGQVQGVGFRPYVFRLAFEFSLTGFVGNNSAGVFIELQGDSHKIDGFLSAFANNLPALAEVHSIKKTLIPLLQNEKSFNIIESSGQGKIEALISPEIATCPECHLEILDKKNRRYLYPFTNCTNCGPRYSITHSLPYDRSSTTMACFELCPDCKKEYLDPLNRRFHAQPNACPSCGPQLAFLSKDNALSDKSPFLNPAKSNDVNIFALQQAAKALNDGKILALKGLGGFNLVCDASNYNAVLELRKRKLRPCKPFAVMVESIKSAKCLVSLDKTEENILSGPIKPIVLCRTLSTLPPNFMFHIAPKMHLLGVMLPYTPLHIILLQMFSRLKEAHIDSELPATLIMTSGNNQGEPITLGNRESIKELLPIADAFLIHNRDILIRNDDSVVRAIPKSDSNGWQEGDAEILFLRRARGYAPKPILYGNKKHTKSIVALGAGLKNTICITRGNEAFVSQYLGDMDRLSVSNFQSEVYSHLCKLLNVSPIAAIKDLHPNFHTNSITDRLDQFSIQHHHAHSEAVIAENFIMDENLKKAPHLYVSSQDSEELGSSNRLIDAILALTLDGTGYATNSEGKGEIWGGEIFSLSINSSQLPVRRGHLSPLTLPGGEAAIKSPWRIAHALIIEGIKEGHLSKDIIEKLPWYKSSNQEFTLLEQMVEKKINSPTTSSCGRWFDAFAALLGICCESSFEGEAAMSLEAAIYESYSEHTIPYDIKLPDSLSEAKLISHNDIFILDLRPTFFSAAKILYQDEQTMDTASLSASFHINLVRGLVQILSKISAVADTKKVALSGGCMQNMTLLTLLKNRLRLHNLVPITHRNLPPNDGCISFGQAVWLSKLMNN